ncbi:MAG: hypothetical protein GY845_15055 [Planctomycetes bacterium]|nr:hypothetical protein [Planctomycetota bacterium]
MKEPMDFQPEEFEEPIRKVNPMPRPRPQQNPEMVQVPRNMLEAMTRMSEALATRYLQTYEEE